MLLLRLSGTGQKHRYPTAGGGDTATVRECGGSPRSSV
jgi:hypothetical protein